MKFKCSATIVMNVGVVVSDFTPPDTDDHAGTGLCLHPSQRYYYLLGEEAWEYHVCMKKKEEGEEIH